MFENVHSTHLRLVQPQEDGGHPCNVFYSGAIHTNLRNNRLAMGELGTHSWNATSASKHTSERTAGERTLLALFFPVAGAFCFFL